MVQLTGEATTTLRLATPFIDRPGLSFLWAQDLPTGGWRPQGRSTATPSAWGTTGGQMPRRFNDPMRAAERRSRLASRVTAPESRTTALIRCRAPS